MLEAAVWTFVLALVVGLLGFGGLAGSAAGVAKAAFYVLLVLAIVGFLVGRWRGA